MEPVEPRLYAPTILVAMGGFVKDDPQSQLISREYPTPAHTKSRKLGQRTRSSGRRALHNSSKLPIPGSL